MLTLLYMLLALTPPAPQAAPPPPAAAASPLEGLRALIADMAEQPGETLVTGHLPDALFLD